MYRSTSIALAAVVIALAPAATHAQPIKRTAIEAQPLTYVRNGDLLGCGVRLTGGEAAAPASSWFDVSVNLFRRGVGIAQSIAYEIRRSEDAASRPAKVPVQSAWVQGTEGGARRGENSERRDSLVYQLGTDEVLALFETVAAGEPVTLGIKRWGQRTDAVYTGTAALTSESRQQISACLERLSG